MIETRLLWQNRQRKKSGQRQEEKRTQWWKKKIKGKGRFGSRSRDQRKRIRPSAMHLEYRKPSDLRLGTPYFLASTTSLAGPTRDRTDHVVLVAPICLAGPFDMSWQTSLDIDRYSASCTAARQLISPSETCCSGITKPLRGRRGKT